MPRTLPLSTARNVLWVVVDSLRADRLGCYGARRLLTPHLDRLARECVRFRTAISPHIPTHPAHTTFFSGRDVFAHGVVAQGGHHTPPPETPLLPARLREAGYWTAAVDNLGRWFQPGFARYEDYPRWDHDGSRPWRIGEEVTRRGLDVLTEAAGLRRPFFLFLHYWDPHSPYLPPPPFDRMFYGGNERSASHTSMDPVWASEWFANYFGEWLPGVRDIEFVKAQYDAEVAYADCCLAHLWNRLGELGLWDDTLVVLQADHGEELDDHGCWFDHHGLYDTNVHVPLLVRFPGGCYGGTVVEEPVTLLDLAPTVAVELGLPDLLPPGEGRPLQPLIREDAAPGAPFAAYLTECTWMRKRGWRTTEWKLIEALEPDCYGKPPRELYHLPTDPGEQRNLAEERSDVTAQLQEALHHHVARRLEATGLPDPLVEQADALRIWQPRFIAGRRNGESPHPGDTLPAP